MDVRSGSILGAAVSRRAVLHAAAGLGAAFLVPATWSAAGAQADARS